MIKYIWSIITRGVWYHVELMDKELDPVYHKYTGRRVYSSQDLPEVKSVAGYWEDKGEKVRINVVLGISP